MVERRVDAVDRHRAHRAEILRDDEVGIEPVEGSFVEAVELVAGGHPGLDDGVDLGG